MESKQTITLETEGGRVLARCSGSCWAEGANDAEAIGRLVQQVPFHFAIKLEYKEVSDVGH